MAKNRSDITRLPEEESINDWHASASTMQLQDLATNDNNTFQMQQGWSPADSSRPSTSHRQAEKRRRDRINAQLARLRKLVPMSDKMDKAALLERVVDQIKELKSNASEIGKFLTIPTETDDITIECETNIVEQHPINPHHQQEFKNNNNNVVLIKVSLCCEDRPDLISDLIRALKGLNLTTIGADFASLGGRIKSILILYYKDNTNVDNKEAPNCNVSAIKQSLMAVLTRVISWSTSSNTFRVTSKRQRFFFAS